jgi:hypothetical protein
MPPSSGPERVRKRFFPTTRADPAGASVRLKLLASRASRVGGLRAQGRIWRRVSPDHLTPFFEIHELSRFPRERLLHSSVGRSS